MKEPIREYIGFLVPPHIKKLLKDKSEENGKTITELGTQIFLEWEKKINKIR